MTESEFYKEIKQYFTDKWQPERRIVIQTGAGGMDLFEETMESYGGFKRIYLGNKILRILRKLKSPIRKSVTGRNYKLVKK